MKKHLIEREDGGVSVLVMQDDADPAEEIAKWQTSSAVRATGNRTLSDDEIPSDRTFRDAWGHDLSVDIPKAREIHKQRLRQMRAPKMAALDIEFTRALGKGDQGEAARVEAERQKLRDVTTDPMIDAAKTPEELKAAIPNILK